MSATASAASPTLRANTVTQSSAAHAGTTPRVDSRPSVGLMPTQPLYPAGTRPEPAVSVPSAKHTRPRPTADAEPLEEPPGMKRASKALGATP